MKPRVTLKKAPFFLAALLLTLGLTASRNGAVSAQIVTVPGPPAVGGWWRISQNYLNGWLYISQSGTSFTGQLCANNEPCDSVSGTIDYQLMPYIGDPPSNPYSSVKITFTRSRSGSFSQVFTGNLYPRGCRPGFCPLTLMQGTFNHNGAGVYPFYATIN